MAVQLEPCCESAPTPEALLADWNLDPVLMSAIALMAVWTLLRFRVEDRFSQWVVFIGLCVIAFVPPLCALSSALFSARAFHHIILISIAAPLGWTLICGRSMILDRFPPMAAFVAHTVMIWLWHLPLPYAWALSGSFAYLAISLLLSALWLWREILDPERSSGSALAVCGATILQMTLLGAS